MSLLDHSRAFLEFAPYLIIEEYGRDRSGDGPRFRLELKGAPPDVQQAALNFRMKCVACDHYIHPFRQRKKSVSIYFAATCPLDVHVGCSRGDKATREYKAVAAAVLRLEPSNLKKARKPKPPRIRTHA